MEIISTLDFNSFMSHLSIENLSQQSACLFPCYELLAARTRFNDRVGSVPADYLKKHSDEKISWF